MGVLLALVGAAAFAGMNVAIRKGVRPGDRDNGVLTTVVVNVGLFSMLMVGLVVLYGMPNLSVAAVAAFAAAGLASTFIGRTTLFAGIRRAGAVRAAAVKNATPLVTLAIALTLLGERLTPVAAAGVALVLIGVALVVRESMDRPDRNALATDRPDNAAREGIEAELLAAGNDEITLPKPADRPAGAQGSGSAMLVGLAFASLAALSFGAGHALRKVGMDILPDAAVGATVGSWAALVGYTAAAALRGRLGRIPASITGRRPYFWLAGLGGGVGQIAFFAALNFAPVAHVSVVAASETILTVAFAGLVAHRTEQISRQLLLPAILVFVGVTAIALSR